MDEIKVIPCFKRGDLWSLREATFAKFGESGMFMNQERMEQSQSVKCPCCGQEAFKFLGHTGFMGEAMYLCLKCLYTDGINNLTEKDALALIREHFSNLDKQRRKLRQQLAEVEERMKLCGQRIAAIAEERGL